MRAHQLARGFHRRRLSSSLVVQLGRRIRIRLQTLTEALQTALTTATSSHSSSSTSSSSSSYEPIETKSSTYLNRNESNVSYLSTTVNKPSDDPSKYRTLKTEAIKQFQSDIPTYLRSIEAVIQSASSGLQSCFSNSTKNSGGIQINLPVNSRPLVAGSDGPIFSANPPCQLSSSSSSSSCGTRITKAALNATIRRLFHDVTSANSNMSRHLSVEEMCKQLRKYPESKGLASKIGGVRQLLLVQRLNRDPVVEEGLREALALLGHCNPPIGWGIRILSIDGGGLRGIMALEVLRRLEELTGCRVHEMFDYICGVSTGAILAVLLGARKLSIANCEQMYKQIGTAIFTQNPIWGAGKLVLSHAFYDTATWTKLIREHVGESKLLIETRRDPDTPLIAAISTVVNRPLLEAFVFRNYIHPARVQSQYRGTHTAHLWESIRASAAAPGYFEEYQLGQDVHQDGGILVNNPTALAIHECKHLWPNEQLQCVVSLGGGRYEPQPSIKPGVGQDANVEPSATGLKMKLMKIVDSATDTEAVHTTLHDLLTPTVYFRINPYITENIPINESRLEKIEQLQQDARMYLRRNDAKVKLAAEMIKQPRTRMQSFKHFLSEKSTEFFG